MKFGFVNKTDKGSALVIATIVVLILASIGVGLIQLGMNARMQVVRSVSAFSARAAADAGLAHAMRSMTDSWNGATDKAAWLAGWKDVTGVAEGAAFGPVSFSDTFGGATFSYAINKGTKANGYEITSTGTAAGKTRIIHAAIVLKSALKGIGAKEKIDIFPGNVLGTVPAGDTFILQTNSTDVSAITLKPGLTIPGDVVCGPGGDPCSVINTAANTTIEGLHSASEDYIEFPPVYVPAGLLALPFGTPTIDPCDSQIAYIYADMKLDELQFWAGALTGVGTLYIQGNPGVNSGEVNIFVDGITNLTSGTQIIVTKDSSMTLYLGGDMDIKPGADIVYSDTPHVTDAEIIEAASSITIKGTVAPDGTPLCTDIQFNPNSDFYGTIYAPDADPLYIAPGGNFYGAIVGSNNITLKPGGTFMFIPSLTDIGDVEILYVGLKQGSWWEE
jgi:hypothetical protein